jgi:ribonuclease-3
MRAELADLEQALGYRFTARILLLRALTHRSCLQDAPAEGWDYAPASNEQLEFLGDAILGFLVSEHVYERCREFSEGQLSRLKNHVVSAAHLGQVAARLRLGDHLRLGRGEEQNLGRGKRALQADALEAILAAIYLDGGLERCREFVHRHIFGGLGFDYTEWHSVPLDYKSALQQHAQAAGLPGPVYVLVKTEGPVHARAFTIEARLGRDQAAQATASSKKQAEQRAAEVLLRRLTGQAVAPPG